jgi:hypothetical protein
MPEDLRPIADLYLVVPAQATEEVQPPMPRPTISRGPRWKNRPEVKILQPGELYATYDLATDQEALAAMAERGMSQPEIDAVIFRSHERNWPEGIDQFDERFPRLDQFKKFKTYLGAKWSDKVLLIVPRGEEQEDARPAATLRRHLLHLLRRGRGGAAEEVGAPSPFAIVQRPVLSGARTPGVR